MGLMSVSSSIANGENNLLERTSRNGSEGDAANPLLYKDGRRDSDGSLPSRSCPIPPRHWRWWKLFARK